MKFLPVLLMLCTVLTARENPFSPIKQEPKIFIPTKIAPNFFKDIKPIEKPKQIKIIKQKIIKKSEIKKITSKSSSVKKKISVKKEKKTIKKAVKKTSKFIYKNKFTKIKTFGNKIKIYTKDTLLDDYIHKKTLSFNFEKYDTIKRNSKKVYSKYIDRLDVGFHGYYHKFIFHLKDEMIYQIQKKSYGYLIILL